MASVNVFEVIEVIEVEGVFIVDKRNLVERRFHRINHCRKYDRRMEGNRRANSSTTIDILL